MILQLPDELLSVQTFQDGDYQEITHFRELYVGAKRGESKKIMLICEDQIITPTKSWFVPDPFIMTADNSIPIPLVHLDGTPVTVTQEVEVSGAEGLMTIQQPMFMGEFNMWMFLVFRNEYQNYMGLYDAFASAIFRRKGITTTPFVFCPEAFAKRS